MALAIVQNTAVAAYQGNSTTVVSGTSLGYQRTLNVTAGSMLVARVVIRNLSAAGALLTAITDSKSQTWTLRRSERDDGLFGYGWIYTFDTYNAAAGSTTVSLDCTLEDTNNYIAWMVTEVSGALTTNAHDTGSSAEVDGTPASIAVPATATLSQADEIVFAFVGAKWWYDLNGGVPPTGWTLDGLNDSNNIINAMFVSKIVTATTAQSVTFVGVANQSVAEGAMAMIQTYKAGASVNYRVRALFNTAINGDTGITALVWKGSADTVLARQVTSLTAEASGGILFIPLPATGYTNGESVNVIAYNSVDTSGLITASVETY